jgi:hypothetical protein
VKLILAEMDFADRGLSMSSFSSSTDRDFAVPGRVRWAGVTFN